MEDVNEILFRYSKIELDRRKVEMLLKKSKKK